MWHVSMYVFMYNQVYVGTRYMSMRPWRLEINVKNLTHFLSNLCSEKGLYLLTWSSAVHLDYLGRQLQVLSCFHSARTKAVHYIQLFMCIPGIKTKSLCL